jgi:hypothetical protein
MGKKIVTFASIKLKDKAISVTDAEIGTPSYK